MTSSDRFPVPVGSAVKSNLTAWCCQNVSSRALNALTVQASTTTCIKLGWVQILGRFGSPYYPPVVAPVTCIIMVALCNRADHYIFFILCTRSVSLQIGISLAFTRHCWSTVFWRIFHVFHITGIAAGLRNFFLLYKFTGHLINVFETAIVSSVTDCVRC